MVAIALSLLESTGTPVNDFLRLLKKVGALVVAMFIQDNTKLGLEEALCTCIMLVRTRLIECKHSKLKCSFVLLRFTTRSHMCRGADSRF